MGWAADFFKMGGRFFRTWAADFLRWAAGFLPTKIGRGGRFFFEIAGKAASTPPKWAANVPADFGQFSRKHECFARNACKFRLQKLAGVFGWGPKWGPDWSTPRPAEAASTPHLFHQVERLSAPAA